MSNIQDYDVRCKQALQSFDSVNPLKSVVDDFLKTFDSLLLEKRSDTGFNAAQKKQINAAKKVIGAMDLSSKGVNKAAIKKLIGEMKDFADEDIPHSAFLLERKFNKIKPAKRKTNEISDKELDEVLDKVVEAAKDGLVNASDAISGGLVKGKAFFNKVMKHGVAKGKLEKQDKDSAKVK